VKDYSALSSIPDIPEGVRPTLIWAYKTNCIIRKLTKETKPEYCNGND
jgi:hypothetical protein